MCQLGLPGVREERVGPMSGRRNGPSPRREVIKGLAIGLGLGTFCPLAVTVAWQSRKTYKVGFLRGTSPRPRELKQLRQGLRERGYVEGDNMVIEQRYANGALDRLPSLADELVQLKVDVIVVGGTFDAKAAKAATTAIPIVFTIPGDPVGSGLVASLARPGGNLTGMSNLQGELGGKRLQLLIEAVPQRSPIAVLTNPANPMTVDLQGARTAARTLSVRLQEIHVRSPKEFAGAFAAMTSGGAGALLTMADPVFGTDPRRLATLAVESRLPAMFFEKVFVDAGGLMSFGPNIFDQFRRAAGYVDKILKGMSPADIPVEQPTRFELAINMQTAKTLDVSFPRSILIQATDVVQ